MKIAVCLYGNMHRFPLCKKNISNFFGENADYFLYTSDRLIEYPTAIEMQHALNHAVYTEKDLEKDFEFLRLKDHMILPFKDYCERYQRKNYSYKVQYFMHQALHLKRKYEFDNDINYDIVAFCRTDMCFMTQHGEKINWCQVERDKQWIISNGEVEHVLWDKFSKPWDYVIIGTNSLMDHLSNAIQFKEIQDTYNRTHTFLFAEECMDMYLRKYNMHISHVDDAHRIGFNTKFNWHHLPPNHNMDADYITNAELSDLKKFKIINRKYKAQNNVR